nr:reverse transcriptase domain-containing protein [Tanacetum cinerariifolium]
MEEINKNLMKVLQINQQVKAVTHNCETCGGPHSYNDCPATVGQTQNVYVVGAYNQGGASHGQNSPPAYQSVGYQAPVQQASIPQPQVVTTTEFTNYIKANDAILKNMQTNMTSLTNSNLELKNMFGQFMKMNTASSSGLGTLLSNTITNPKEDLKGITTRSVNAYKGPMIPTTSYPLPKVVEQIVALKAEMEEINKNLMKVLQINQQVKAVTHNCETCGGPHSYNDCPATVGQTQNVYVVGAYNQGGNSYQPQGNRDLLSYRSDNYLGPPGFNQNQNRTIKIRTTKIKTGIKETIMEFLRGTTKEDTNSSKELVMVKIRLQLINPWVTKLRFSKPRFLNRKL